MASEVPGSDILLCEATIDDIAQEIGKRYFSAIIIAHAPADNGSDGTSVVLRHTGGTVASLGLITFAKEWLLK